MQDAQVVHHRAARVVPNWSPKYTANSRLRLRRRVRRPRLVRLLGREASATMRPDPWPSKLFTQLANSARLANLFFDGDDRQQYQRSPRRR